MFEIKKSRAFLNLFFAVVLFVAISVFDNGVFAANADKPAVLSSKVSAKSQNTYGDMAFMQSVKWDKATVTVYLGNVPKRYRKTVEDSITYWKQFFNFEISENPDSDVNIVWVKDLRDGKKVWVNPYAMTVHNILLGDHTCVVKIRSKHFLKTELNEIMLHELGHVVGLDDSENSNDIMYSRPRARLAFLNKWYVGRFCFIPYAFPVIAQDRTYGKNELSPRDVYTYMSLYPDSVQNIKLVRYYNENYKIRAKHQQELKNLEQSEQTNYVKPLGNQFDKKAIADVFVPVSNETKISSNYVIDGDKYFSKNDYLNAIISYKQALEMNPKDVNALINLSLVYMDLEKYDLAVENLDKAMVVNNTNDIVYGYLGLAYQKKGDNVKAVDYYKKALLLNPNSEVAKGNLYIISK